MTGIGPAVSTVARSSPWHDRSLHSAQDHSFSASLIARGVAAMSWSCDEGRSDRINPKAGYSLTPICATGGHQIRTNDQSFEAETSITGWSSLTR